MLTGPLLPVVVVGGLPQWPVWRSSRHLVSLMVSRHSSHRYRVPRWRRRLSRCVIWIARPWTGPGASFWMHCIAASESVVDRPVWSLD